MFRLFLFLIFFLSTSYCAKKVSVQLLWLDQFQFAGYYIAKEKGFYKKQNLDVQIKKFSKKFNQKAIVDDILKGESTFGVGRSNIIVDKANGKDIVALSSIFQSSPLVLLSLKRDDLKNISDIKNKKIMMTNSLSSNTSLKAMLFSKGIRLEDNEIIKHSFNIDDLINKKVDLIAAYITNEPFLLEEKAIEYKIFNPKDEGFDFYSDLLFTSSKEYKNNKDVVKKFLKATMDGWKYAFNNIEESVSIIYEKYNIQNKTKKTLLYEARELKKLAYFEGRKLGSLEYDKIKRIYDIYKVMGEVKGELDIRDFVYSFKKLNLSKEQKQFIQKTKKITVHNEENWVPYNFNEYGIPKGYSIDYMNLLASKIGLNIEYVSGKSWDEYLKMTKNRELDIMLNVVDTPDRREFLSFTSSYAQSLSSIYTLDSKKSISSLKDLKGKIVAVPKGFYTAEILKTYYPEIKLLLTKDMVEAINSVAFKKADATVSDFAVANYLIQSMGIVNLHAVTNVKDKKFISKLNLGVHKDNYILKEILQKGINQISDEEMIALRAKWFSTKFNFSQKNLTFTRLEKDMLRKVNKIRVCVKSSWAPYEYIEDGKHMGVTSDYLKYFEKILAMNFITIPTKSLSQSLEFIKDKKCDILPSSTITISALDYMNFTKPYIVSNYVLAMKTGQKQLNEVFKTEKIGILKGFDNAKYFNTLYPNFTIVEFDSLEKGLSAVNKDKIDGFIGLSSTISSLINNKKFHDIKIIEEFEKQKELSIGIRNDRPVLLSIFQKVLSSFSKKEKELILRKWITIKYQNEIDYSFIISLFLPFILSLIIIIFYLWNIRLKREIKTSSKLAYELQNSLDDFKILVDATIEAIFIINKNGKCTEANDAAKKLFGFSKKSDYLNKHIYFIVSSEDINRVRRSLKEEQNFPKEVNLVKKDGTVFPALVKGESLKRIDQTTRIVSIVDLTELKQKEHLLFQQSKMALMGEMMSAIAHQWRQPLNALATLNMQIEMKLEFQGDMNLEDYKPISDGINNQLSYMSKTIDDFRDFFIPSKRKSNFSICNVIKEVIEILKPQLDNNNIKYTSTEGTFKFIGFPNEFKQVIINIINNSKDAILSNKIKDGEINILVEEMHSNIFVHIRDNGGGIDKKIINKVFNPYFTTKFEAKGTGIGLYMSKMIIEKSMGGELLVESENTKTTFTIVLPKTT